MNNADSKAYSLQGTDCLSDGESSNLTHTQAENCEQKKCHILRAAYNQVKKANDILAKNGIPIFLPQYRVEKIVFGRNVMVNELQIRGHFFSYGAEKELQNFVYNNGNLLNLRFSYHKEGIGANARKYPKVVPGKQMEDFIHICNVWGQDTLFAPFVLNKFRKGRRDKVVDGDFKRVEGLVVRFNALATSGCSNRKYVYNCYGIYT